MTVVMGDNIVCSPASSKEGEVPAAAPHDPPTKKLEPPTAARSSTDHDFLPPLSSPHLATISARLCSNDPLQNLLVPLDAPLTPLDLVKLVRYRCRRSDKPFSSRFRVWCAMECVLASTGVDEEGEDVDEERRFLLFGRNVETCQLCSGLCSERTALAQLAMLDDGTENVKVRQVAITSDMPTPLRPGPKCAEYMTSTFNFYADEVPIFLVGTEVDDELFVQGQGQVAAADDEIMQRVSTVTVRTLWPFPSIYQKVPREKLVSHGLACAKAASSSLERLREHSSPAEIELFQLYALLQERWIEFERAAAIPAGAIAGTTTTATNSTNSVDPGPPATPRGLIGNPYTKAETYPILYQAGLGFGTGNKFRFAIDSVVMEYPCSVDAISKLVAFLEEEYPQKSLELEERSPPTCLLYVDQFGNCHAPPSSARAWFAEAGLGNVRTLLQDLSGRVVVRTLKQLYSGAEEVIDWGSPKRAGRDHF